MGQSSSKAKKAAAEASKVVPAGEIDAVAEAENKAPNEIVPVAETKPDAEEVPKANGVNEAEKSKLEAEAKAKAEAEEKARLVFFLTHFSFI